MHLIFPQRTRLIFLSYTKKYVWQSSNEKKTILKLKSSAIRDGWDELLLETFELLEMAFLYVTFINMMPGSKDTLHFYDKIGLLVPDHIDPNNQYRYYSLRNLWQLDMITTCRKLNIPLDFSVVKGQYAVQAMSICGTKVSKMRQVSLKIHE